MLSTCTVLCSDGQSVVQKYQHLYKANTKTTHYLLSKVYRAKERLDEEHPEDATRWREQHGDPTDAARRAAQDAAAAAGSKAGEEGGTGSTGGADARNT